MVKRINVSVSDELYEQIESVKQGFSKDFSISKICQIALETSLEDARARNHIWERGCTYGIEYTYSLSPKEQKKAKVMAANFPRKLPENVLNILLKYGIIDKGNLNKHLNILHDWENVMEQFDPELYPDKKCQNTQGYIDIFEWGGAPAVLDGEEVFASEVTDNRWEKIQELWRQGLIAGIAEATKSIEVSANGDD